MFDRTDKTPNSQFQEQEIIKSENMIKANTNQKGFFLPKIKRQGAATREDSFPFEDFKAKPQAQSNKKKIPVLMQDFNQEF